MSSTPVTHPTRNAATRVQRIDQLRIVGASGTNKVMAGELSRLSRRAIGGARIAEPEKMGTGALIYPFDPAFARVAASYLRTCTRVFWDVLETRAERLEPLYDDVIAGLGPDIAQWIWDGARISVEAHDVRTFEAGERQVVGTVKNAWVDAAAQHGMRLHVDPQQPDVVIAVRTDEGVTRISIDMAGRATNQRGYRHAQGLAPLREDTAAVLLMLARYDARSDVLIDPMAGSGTIAIEAACMANARPIFVPPRAPLFPKLPAMREVSQQVASPLFADTHANVLANDHDPEAIALLRRSMVTAEVTAAIETSTADFRSLTPERVQRFRQQRGLPDGPGLILSNPPYGERLDDPDLIGLYRDLGRWCRQFRGYRAGFLVANRDFEPAFGIEPRVKKPLRNGALRGYFFLYEF